MNPFPTHIYTGQSMAPLFRPGDGLRIVAVAFGQVRPGDVIVFYPPPNALTGSEDTGSTVPSRPDRTTAPWPPSATEGSRRIVHRVVAVAPEGLVTRGDANLCPDEGFVIPDQLEGRVVALERDGHTRPVTGGRAGLLRAALARLRMRVTRTARRIASVPYGLLRASRIVRRIWHPSLRTLTVATPQGPCMKTLHGHRTVARWWPATGRFECVKPYDLVIERPGRPPRGADTPVRA